ncbi:MAG: BamA/TamA family outer membrane protein [Bacteroidia bacterium]
MNTNRPIKLFIVLTILLLVNFKQLFAQTDSSKHITFSLLPILISDPFVGFGYGVLTNVNYILGPKETTRFSNTQAYILKTTNGQFAVQLNHQIFLKDENWIVQGKLQYLDWPEYTYALGANTPNEGLSKDTVKYKALDFEERVLYKLKKYNFLGLQYKLYSAWDVNGGKDSGQFFENNAIGTNKFTASGIGVHYIFDSRDNVQNAFKGKYIELAVNPYAQFMGSTQNWLNLRLDARTYYQFKTTKTLVIANRFIAEHAIGDAPYMIMPQTGRLFSTRAYVQGRYRGKLFLAYEAELRAHLWRFIGGVLFAGANTVSEPNDEIKYINPSAGAGLRFNINKAQRTNIRVDYAVGANNNSGLYFHITEVF